MKEVAIAAGVVLLLLFLVAVARTLALPGRARKQFIARRPELQGQFLAAASASGKPRGLRWKGIDWDADAPPRLARDRHTGEIVGLVPITIQFEAVEGSDMEGLPAVGNLRNASAVFFFRGGRWRTGGKAVFNLNPDEALAHFKDQYTPLEGTP